MNNNEANSNIQAELGLFEDKIQYSLRTFEKSAHRVEKACVLLVDKYKLICDEINELRIKSQTHILDYRSSINLKFIVACDEFSNVLIEEMDNLHSFNVGIEGIKKCFELFPEAGLSAQNENSLVDYYNMFNNCHDLVLELKHSIGPITCSSVEQVNSLRQMIACLEKLDEFYVSAAQAVGDLCQRLRPGEDSVDL